MEKDIQNLLKSRYFLKSENEWDDVAKRVSGLYLPIYELIRDKKFIPSTPTLLNANTKGERKGTLSSCFPMGIEDSIEGIFESLKESAIVTKASGGVGYDFSNLRSSKEGVKGIGNKNSSGPLPFIQIFNQTLEGVQQGGCIVSDSYIYTEKGIEKISEIIKEKEKGWYNNNINIINNDGIFKSRNKFINGKDRVYRIVTENGSFIEATENHKFLIFKENGFEWVELKNLQESDYIINYKNNLKNENDYLLLDTLKEDVHFNEKNINLPKYLDEDLSFLIGYYIGDGYSRVNTKNNYEIGFVVNNQQKYIENKIEGVLKKLFGNELNCFKQKSKGDCFIIVVRSKQLYNFFKNNYFLKKDSKNAVVPKKIRLSNNLVMWSFLHGLFEADGTLCHNYPLLNTSSDILANEIKIMLNYLGCNCNNFKSKKYNSFSKEKYINSIKLIGRESYFKFLDNIDIDKNSRFYKMHNFIPSKTKQKNCIIPYASYWLNSVKNIGDKKLKKEVLRYIRGDRNFNYVTYNRLREKNNEFKEAVFIPQNLIFSKIKNISYVGIKETFDIEVEDVNKYVANSIIVHNSRRGAGMALLSIYHPDILDFIDAKIFDKTLQNNKYDRFNFSIKVPNSFYEELENFPDDIMQVQLVTTKEWIDLEDKDGKKITVKQLWDRIIKNAWKNAEPGIFNESLAKERCSVINLNDNVIANPCSEFVNIPYSSCNLGSLNLSLYVKDGEFDMESFVNDIQLAVIFLNKVIDNNIFMIDRIKETTLNIRPIGLGIMGLGHLFYKLGIPYNSKKALHLTSVIFNILTKVGMIYSIGLAKEEGVYPAFDYDIFYNANKRFFDNSEDSKDILRNLKKYGIRNSCITSIAPTGSISFIANTSSGIEPVYQLSYVRKIEKLNKEYDYVYINDPVFEQYLDINYKEDKDKILKEVTENNGSCQKSKYLSDEEKKIFVTAKDLTYQEHIDVLGECARNISLSVSKTINLPKDCKKEDVANAYIEAYNQGVIGVTVYRDGSREGILVDNIPSDGEDNLFIKRTNAPKRPKDLPCDIYETKVKDKKFIILIGIYNGSLYEIFVDDNTNGKIDVNKHKHGIIRKRKKECYDLIIKNGEEKVIVENLSKNFGGTYGVIARMISMSLRHGTPLQFIVGQLCKTKEFVSFEKAVSRVLKKHIKNGEKVMTSEKCPNCESDLVYESGCVVCKNCGFGKCG